MKYIILICLLISTLYLFANPIVPQLFSELYVDDTSWWLELCSMYTLNATDSIRISNQNEVVQFRVDQGTIIGNCLLINSAQCPLLISPTGADLSGAVKSSASGGNWYDYSSHFVFSSSYPNNCISGQSLVNNQVTGYESTDYIITAEAIPTPGDHPFHVTTFGPLNGYVRDHNLVPVPNARISRFWYDPSSDVYTDTNGYYAVPNLEGYSHSFAVFVNDIQYASENVNIIPTQITNHDFILTDYYVSNHDQTQKLVAPAMISANPVRAGSDMKFDLGNQATEGTSIKIFNLKGQSVTEVYSTFTSGVISVPLPSNLASGIYLYRIQDVHKTLAKGKFTVIE
jgi:hypothetical protein